MRVLYRLSYPATESKECEDILTGSIIFWFQLHLQGHAGLGFAIGEGRRAQDGENGIFIRNVTEGGTAYKVMVLETFRIMSDEAHLIFLKQRK